MFAGSEPEPVHPASKLPELDAARVAVVGLGYVGLPIAMHMARCFPAVGYDTDGARVDELSRGLDRTKEVTSEELAASQSLRFACDAAALKECNVFIVAVPTPIDDAKRPDLTALRQASAAVGEVMSPGAVVVYESTVYPGATEEVCVPIL
jgi:UDP-N-acetyl-D-galactosamine dehydrogenase